ncbi:hypothetical protein CYD94_04935 [Ralstonia solanacearum]|uniref:Uncharacterized protein n=1 Tax=Ralstonia pseudosolanacearum TaxID=1310165 RepID=A0A454TMW3_9RALS|nr:hypothetical protein ACH51_14175 [Ralstonia solanacearum]API75698.1 hypothetical protein AC251_14780 [Ralstonia pseudosolanacearum]AUS41622.1 hypothetical protein CYD94_04935 [Ralstonia solanacearum]KAF3461052.1 hypothetical protein GO278_003042 [Ralstonia solanacearum]NKA04550.1 hypothetical protein [Ralstonia solanacearum]
MRATYSTTPKPIDCGPPKHSSIDACPGTTTPDTRVRAMLNVLLQNESVATAGAICVRLRKASVLRLVVPSGVKCSRRPKPCDRPALL